MSLRPWETKPQPIASTYYVDQQSETPLPPYASWPTAAHSIQDAVDIAVGGADLQRNGSGLNNNRNESFPPLRESLRSFLFRICEGNWPAYSRVSAAVDTS